MASPNFNRDRAARVLVDAITLGDRTASERHGVSEKTIQRYRARLLTDLELSQVVQKLGREAEHGWHFARARFLRLTFTKLEAMVESATPEHFGHVIDALKAAGELDIAHEVLSVGARAHQQDSEAAGDAAGGAGTRARPEGGDGHGGPGG